MYEYRITTKIDITRSNPNRAVTDEILLGQQSNFNTFLQGISLRANIDWLQDPKHIGNYWQWDFFVEQKDVFRKDDDPVGLLIEDLHGIPVVGNLTNPIAIFPPIIRAKGKDLNTWITFIRSD